jgi:hypothetical protein
MEKVSSTMPSMSFSLNGVSATSGTS